MIKIIKPYIIGIKKNGYSTLNVPKRKEDVLLKEWGLKKLKLIVTRFF